MSQSADGVREELAETGYTEDRHLEAELEGETVDAVHDSEEFRRYLEEAQDVRG